MYPLPLCFHPCCTMIVNFKRYIKNKIGPSRKHCCTTLKTDFPLETFPSTTTLSLFRELFCRASSKYSWMQSLDLSTYPHAASACQHLFYISSSKLIMNKSKNILLPFADIYVIVSSVVFMANILPGDYYLCGIMSITYAQRPMNFLVQEELSCRLLLVSHTRQTHSSYAFLSSRPSNTYNI